MKEDTNLKKELESVKILAEEYLNGWKRAKADLINFQKDVAKQKEDWIKFSTSGLILTILPIYESMEKLIESIAVAFDKDAFVEGVRNIKKQFDDVFENLGVEKIKTIGEKFDPNFHECVSVKKTEGAEAGKILEEVQAGYLMNGEVIRVAKVVVAEAE